jgi:hypothetical protein
MAQKTAWDGAALTESDINTYLMGEGGAWTSWTPTVTQSGSVTVTNTRSRYARYGRTIVASFDLTVTGSGSANNAITVSLPVTAAAAGVVPVGTARLVDTGTSTTFGAICVLATTTTIWLNQTSTNSTTTILGSTSSENATALASGDIIAGTVTYEAAS